MEKYIPYEKLSKKEKKKRDAAQRGTWGEINPVTRKPKNSRAYDRRKAQNWRREDHGRTDSVPSFLQKAPTPFGTGAALIRYEQPQRLFCLIHNEIILKTIEFRGHINAPG